MQPDCAVSVVPGPAQDESIRQVLGSLIGERQYELWFRQKTRLVVEDDSLVVYAASPFHQKWLQKQHRPALAQAARLLLGPMARVRFEVDAALSVTVAGSSTELTVASKLRPTALIVADERPLRLAAADEPAAAPLRGGRRFADLSDFVAGSGNELALTAVRQISERPDGAGGPLFIYGPVGMGKTHLLEGLYRAIRR